MRNRRETTWSSIVVTAVAVLAVGMLGAAPAAAQWSIYGTVGDGSTGTSTLYEIDPATGAVIRTVGTVPYLINGLEWDPTTSTLYGTTSWNDTTFPAGLVIIDPFTAAATTVGSGNVLGGDAVVELACDDATGTLYSWWEWNPDDLVVWDKAAGTVSLVGESGLDTWAFGMAFGLDGVLYFVNGDASVYSIDTGTGASTSLGTVDLSATLGGRAHHGDVHPATGLYYGITDVYGTSPREFAVIDLSTLTLTSVIPTVDGLHTMAFVPANITGGSAAIPTLSWPGIALLALLVVAAGWLLVRRVA